MLKNTSHTISTSLTDLFNLSLSSGIVPTDWKLSNIIPVFKGKGDPHHVSNYRPISLLSVPSKIIERIVHNRVLKYLISNSLLSSKQFGFRPGSSTQEALLTTTNDWSRNLDKGISTAAVFFDLSKAFDKVPHCQLISSLHKIGIAGPLLMWFKSYLTDRSQKVVVDGQCSVTLPVSSGVPQGSILGPLLFSIYLNPLDGVSLSDGSSLALYADDIVLYRPIVSALDADFLQRDVNTIVNWTEGAGLSLNTNKTKFILFSHKRRHPVTPIKVHDSAISVVDSVRYLGVTLTSDLKWNTHISNTCSRARQQLGIIHRSFKEANSSVSLHLYRMVVLPTLDYCSSVWDPHLKILSDKLQSVQKLALRLFFKYSARHVPYTSHLPSLRDRRRKQKIKVCAKILSDSSIIPSSVYTPHPFPSQRLHHSLPLLVPFARTSFHQASFFTSSAVLWNGLPERVVSAPSLASFKNRLKLISFN